tara:strand:- start:9388 stop:9948 length:561 start_codon:yes stop_codon:yes gene_type:complete
MTATVINKKYTPLMPKATAIWLIDNTSLAFEQIAEFCDMHILEIQAIADGDIASSILPQSPISSGQLTKEDIKKCEENPSLKIVLNEKVIIETKNKEKKTRYIPIARRGDKPDAIIYIIRNYPDIDKNKVKKLIGTTTNMIDSIANKTYWNYKELKPRDPVLLGLCSQSDFNKLLEESGIKTDQSN